MNSQSLELKGSKHCIEVLANGKTVTAVVVVYFCDGVSRAQRLLGAGRPVVIADIPVHVIIPDLAAEKKR